MRYRFDKFELDLLQRELREADSLVHLQPQVFVFIVCLIERRARVVSKRELSDLIWPDTVVSEGSLQRVASLARSALKGADGEIIRTFAGHGYRFVAEVQELEANEAPARAAPNVRPRYVASDGVHVAYQTLSQGDVDIVLVLGWAFPMQALFDLLEGVAILHALGELGRVILFDKRGTGLSDRVKELPSLEQRMADLRAVLDEVGSERAVLLGISEGGPLSIAFSVAHPERVAGLLLVGSFPRMAAAPDYPYGWKRSELGQLKAYVRKDWGQGATMLALVPERTRRESIEVWAATAESLGASPGAALDLLEMNLQIDVRDQLPKLRVPTVVLHAIEDRVTAVANGRFMAEHIPGAELVQVASDDHAFLFEGRDPLLAQVRRLIAGEASGG